MPKYMSSSAKIYSLLLLAIFMALALPLSRPVYAADPQKPKLVVVDVESILENSTAISHIRETMNTLSESIQREITNTEIKFKVYEKDLLDKQYILNAEEFEQLVARFQQNVSKTQKQIHLKKLALEQSYSEAVETVHKTTMLIIGELAKANDYSVVLPSNQVLFVTNDLNITLEVITALNERLKKVPVNYEKFIE